MTKEKVSIFYRAGHIFAFHPFIKIISLILAIIVWFYVHEEMIRFN